MKARSSVEEHHLDTVGVGGSIPPVPTTPPPRPAPETVPGGARPAAGVTRHSAEHVMADAVKRLFPEAQIDVGRADHSEKFQYDFLVDRPFTPEDLEKIEKEMLGILAEGAAFTREVVTRDQAIAL